MSRRRVVVTTAVNLSIALGSGVGGVLLARGLGPTQRGDYSILFTWFLVIQAVAEAGLFGASVYFTSRHPKSAHLVVKALFAPAVVQALVCAAATAYVAVTAPMNMSLRDGFLMGAVSLVFLNVGGVWSFALYGKSIAQWNVTRSLQVPMYVLGMALFVSLGQLTIMRAFVLYLASVVFTQAISLWFLQRAKAQTSEILSTLSMREVYAYSLPSGAWSLLTLLNRRIDILLLGFLVPVPDLGQYAVAVTFMSLTSPAVAAIGNLALPRLSAASAVGENTDGRRRQAIRRSFLLALAVAMTGAALSVPAIYLLLGDEFRYSAVLAILLAPAAWGAATKQVGADLLRGIGEPKRAARVEAYSLPVTAALVWGGASISGVVGAAIALGMAAVFSSFAMATFASRATDRVNARA